MKVVLDQVILAPIISPIFVNTKHEGTKSKQYFHSRSTQCKKTTPSVPISELDKILIRLEVYGCPDMC